MDFTTERADSMKILQVTAVDFTVDKFLTPLIDRLQREGHDVHVACAKTKPSARHITMHPIAFARNMNMLKHMKALYQLVKLLRQENYDVIHTHTPVASMLARAAAKMAGVPLIIYTAHGFYFHERMPRRQYQVAYMLEKYAARFLSDYVFFQSEEDYALAKDKHFKKVERLVHIGNGVSKERFNLAACDRQATRQALEIPDEAPVFLFVGRQVKEKGLQELMEAFELLPKQAHMMIVGGEVAGDRDSIRLESKERLHILGQREDIPQLLSAADVFVLPSYREGLPRSIIEAMAMGKPVIATNIRGCREEVVHEQTGLLCNVEDAKDLADKMKMFIEEPSLIQTYGEAGLERFLDIYDEEKVLDRQLAIYKMYATPEMEVVE